MDQRIIDILLSSFWPMLKAGLVRTLPLAFLSFFFGLIIAVLVALVQYANVSVLKRLARIYVWLIRGTPLLVQLMIIFYGLPVLGIHSDPFLAALVGFSICEGAYMSEAIRGSLESISKGQREAAICVGLSFWQTMWYVLLPQAFRSAFPALSNSLISLVKDSSLAANITVVEMFMTTQRFAGKYYTFMPLYLEVAFIYLLFCTVISFGQSRIEKRLSLYERKEA